MRKWANKSEEVSQANGGRAGWRLLINQWWKENQVEGQRHGSLAYLLLVMDGRLLCLPSFSSDHPPSSTLRPHSLTRCSTTALNFSFTKPTILSLTNYSSFICYSLMNCSSRRSNSPWSYISYRMYQHAHTGITTLSLLSSNWKIRGSDMVCYHNPAFQACSGQIMTFV